MPLRADAAWVVWGQMVEINTERLVLRDWRESDLAPWAAMNADPEVREHLGPPLTAEQATASARRFQHGLDRDGFGFWAVEVRASGEFIGFTGDAAHRDDHRPGGELRPPAGRGRPDAPARGVPEATGRQAASP